MSAADFLFEIGCEELPANSLISLRDQLAAAFQDEFIKAELSYTRIQGFATPRRIAIVITELALQQPQQLLEKRGPALSAAYDQQHQPTQALQRFASACGVPITALKTQHTDKGEWLYYSEYQEGITTRELLPKIIPTILDRLSMPKRMRWDDTQVSFIRPIRWLCALLGSTPVTFTCYGLTTSHYSFGHRFHAPQAFALKNPADYVDELRARYVIVDFAERQNIIINKAKQLAQSIAGDVKLDAALVTEVTGLVEWPVPLLAQFDAQFLKVPQEALISAMQDHQKCFPILDTNHKLLPYFITVSHIESTETNTVIAGNQRVMRARLADAKFFYTTDSETPLIAHFDHLQHVIFHAKLGTLHDKVERIRQLSRDWAQVCDLDVAETERAAKLCKMDLFTAMVGEFPKLQGIMGYYYALQDRESEAAAIAIKEHYLPRLATDRCPATKLGMLLALADRVDSLVGIFGIHQLPTGEKDPYALRRAANGILRICIECKLHFDLKDMLAKAVSYFTIALPNTHVIEDCLSFLLERLKSYSLELGFTPSMFAAVYAAQVTTPYDFYQRLVAVKQFWQTPNATIVIAANKRVNNLLSKNSLPPKYHIQKELLQEPAEQELVDHLVSHQHQLAPLLQQQAYGEILQRLVALGTPINQFFDNVMVMVDDPAVRTNRLVILATLHQLFTAVADLALLREDNE